MADTTLAPPFAPELRVTHPDWIGTLVHRVEVLRRRARRDRYLALEDRSRRYPWFESMFRSMSGR